MDRNYAFECEKIIAAIGNSKPRLLLHVCCAPCASVVLERLSDYFDITAYYCNPNIYPRSEYDLRAEQLPKLIKGLGLNVKRGICSGEICTQYRYYGGIAGGWIALRNMF